MTSNWFKAEWSTPVIISTAVLFTVLLGVFLLLFTKIAGNHDTETLVMAIATQVVLLVTLVFSYLLSPSGYVIDDKNLTIVRMIKPVVIPLSGITKAEAAVPGLLHGSIRLLGNDGLWGRYGKYSNAALGKYYLYVRSGKGQLLIEAANKYIIAPERPQEFLQSLESARAVAKKTGGTQ